jgi:signal peptidase I
MDLLSGRANQPNISSRGTGPTDWAEIVSLAKSITIFLCIALLLRASVVEAFKIPSSSMVSTLQEGDHILVNKLSYGLRLPFFKETLLTYRQPLRDEIVVFTQPDDPSTPDVDESDTNIIKRIIGLPGDKVEIVGRTVKVNDKPVSEEFAQYIYGGVKDFGPVIVPPERVFLMGDNRDASKDSRYWKDPFLEISRIKGRAFIIYWSWYSIFRMFTILR